MATTTRVTITKAWQQLHTDTCVVQAVNSAETFQFAGSVASPTNDAGLLVRITEATEINLKGAVWCRLPLANRTDTEVITVIK